MQLEQASTGTRGTLSTRCRDSQRRASAAFDDSYLPVVSRGFRGLGKASIRCRGLPPRAPRRHSTRPPWARATRRRRAPRALVRRSVSTAQWAQCRGQADA
eukprot:Amastigsp_a174551_11.p4 type:complete len:101 gc:universal Amastigsp_a174551_11:134-436(+)